MALNTGIIEKDMEKSAESEIFRLEDGQVHPVHQLPQREVIKRAWQDKEFKEQKGLSRSRFTSQITQDKDYFSDKPWGLRMRGHMMKRLLTQGVTFAIITIILSMFATTALAANSTYSGSITTYQNFRDGTNNTVGYDADGYWGRQCWDGVQVFYKRLGMSLSTGNVYNAAGEREAYVKHCWDDANARATNTGTQFYSNYSHRRCKTRRYHCF